MRRSIPPPALRMTDALSMIDSARRGLFTFFAFLGVLVFAVAGTASPASALGLFSQPRYAAIVVDASNGEVLYAKRADDLRYPASITKIMTLYLTFEALSTGRLKLTDRVPLSEHAYNQAPSKSTLRPGESLSVDDAMRIVAVHSANDIAVALAEKIGGSESKFAQLMTLRAQELGMANTRFLNANGLPDPRHVTTARDFAILARAVMRDYPQYFDYFGLRDCVVAGKLYENHNHLLREPGYDGFKTGFTNAAGYNLVASAVRDNRRLITVVLGGSSAALRDENVQTLMNAGFDVMKRRAQPRRPHHHRPEYRRAGRFGPDPAVHRTGRRRPRRPDRRGGRQPAQHRHRRPGVGRRVQDAIAAPPAAPAGPGDHGPPAAEPCVAVSRRHGRTIRRAVACKGEKVQVASAASVDCSKKRGKAKKTCEHVAPPRLTRSSSPPPRPDCGSVSTAAPSAPASGREKKRPSAKPRQGPRQGQARPHAKRRHAEAA